MKRLISNYDLVLLNHSELLKINGGHEPSTSTSFPNDLAFAIVYGLRNCADLLKAIGAGARRGSAARYKNG